jgi:CheY-like chemotaxis protein
VEASSEKSLDLRPILIADDEADDVFLIQRRLKKAGVSNPILVFRDGEELLNFFGQMDARRDGMPLLLLLDLKMPLLDGFDVLAWMRAEARLRGLPVAVITSSTRGVDRDRAVAAGANEFYEKFPTENELAALVDRASRHPFD